MVAVELDRTLAERQTSGPQTSSRTTMHPQHAILLSQAPEASPGERSLFLSTAAPGDCDRQVALMVVLVSVIVFLICVSFAKAPLAPVPAFVPIYQSALVLNDLVTAVLLFGQFNILRSRALLVLASAYLFTACMAVAHMLTFPGLFSTTGLLGAGAQTTAWLYMLWHGGFPLLVLGYALVYPLSPMPHAGCARFGVAISVALVLAVAGALTLAATVGHPALPAIMYGHRYKPVMLTVVSTVWGLSFLALIVMWRHRSRSMLDLWLMVTACAWCLDIALSAVLNGGRFDVGFYAGRIYGLLATSFVLVVLLLENNRMYALLIETHRSERRKAADLQRLSALDPLTGLANRRAFDEALEEEWRRAMRHDTPLCLLMIDVDCFKRFNDRYGHVAGDQCLRRVADALASNTRRAGEIAARYGGEEFSVLLPHIDVDDALHLAQRICQEVRKLDIPHEDSLAANCVTISLGLASAQGLAADGGNLHRNAQDEARSGPTLLVERADEALYAAKHGGRDRVSVVRVGETTLAAATAALVNVP